ncbi:MAG: group III truncated hemoglobin [Sphingobacteriales bacterium]|nr:group III truncated hemoglobin [Sphingobacteriales bacterium]
MKPDISARQDIDTLVKLFYDKLLQDELLRTIFQQTVLSHLEPHLTVIANFWDSILLDAAVYRGNVTEKHIALDERFPLKEQEFNRWLFLWKETVDELFEGEKAEMAKFRAQSIADIMQYKIDYLNKNKS